MPGVIRALVVDDEPLARASLRVLLARDAEVSVAAECGSGDAALAAIRELRPQLLFLDVQMPGLDGFAVVEALGPDALPHVVFVTAFDDYAVRAFDVHAVDYVMKPFDVERLSRALERAKAAIASRRNNGAAARVERLLADIRRERPERVERLLVQGAERSVLLPLSRVDRLESSRNYVVLREGQETFRVRTTLDRLERRLDPRRFVRVSRSAIVNVDRVAELRPWSHGDWVVVLNDGAKLRLTRTFRDRLERFDP